MMSDLVLDDGEWQKYIKHKAGLGRQLLYSACDGNEGVLQATLALIIAEGIDILSSRLGDIKLAIDHVSDALEDIGLNQVTREEALDEH